MRDWNPESTKQLIKGIAYSAYLWGIETALAFSISAPKVVYSAYLWGIETQIDARIGSEVATYSAYLWGIETETCLYYQN